MKTVLVQVVMVTAAVIKMKTIMRFTLSLASLELYVITVHDVTNNVLSLWLLLQHLGQLDLGARAEAAKVQPKNV